MADRGLIERVPGPRRAVRHRVTERREEVRRAGEAVTNEVLAGSLAPLTQERFDRLGDLLDLVLDPVGQSSGES